MYSISMYGQRIEPLFRKAKHEKFLSISNHYDTTILVAVGIKSGKNIVIKGWFKIKSDSTLTINLGKTKEAYYMAKTYDYGMRGKGITWSSREAKLPVYHNADFFIDMNEEYGQGFQYEYFSRRWYYETNFEKVVIKETVESVTAKVEPAINDDDLTKLALAGAVAFDLFLIKKGIEIVTGGSEITPNEECNISSTNDYRVVIAENIKCYTVKRTDISTYKTASVSIGCSDYTHQLDQSNTGFTSWIEKDGNRKYCYTDKYSFNEEFSHESIPFRLHISYPTKSGKKVVLQMNIDSPGLYRIESN